MMEEAIWVAKSLFDRGKTAGSSANLSFKDGGKVYITGSGTCFGRLIPGSFGILDENGEHISGPAPSKEYPLHMAIYKQKPEVAAVIHTHSFYSVLWSCIQHPNPKDIVPAHTPYLRMRLGSVCIVPYAAPGSKELAALLTDRIPVADGWLLANHGPIVGAADIMSAFYAIEELEESARVAWALRKDGN